ncbi:hypothetical protein KP509_18G036000 [Ceratopteris richardii]|uniref:Trichome birefringence-like N-terminal domain-containing protein n=1 Tax=Ceratopteris richardii TaxID=49495 RepID=A0A8T2ST99_CERRI|nr:hypothetical protein KP509_18G036000 [Ceratopteris richardii]
MIGNLTLLLFCVTCQFTALQCELWRGEWVPDDNPPLYTNDTCKYINPLRNCMQNGRPDRGYLHWRWKPLDCELPRFNASYFLEMLRGKTLAFIGDSIARDHGESLLCALTQVEDAQQHEWMLRWFFPSYNFTLSILWSPFLVQYSMDKDYLAMLHLDVPDREWTNQLQEYDIAIFSTGYWHFRKSLYYVNNTLLGGSLHEEVNATKIDLISEFQMTMETVMRHIATQYRGIAMIRTVSVDHFEHGQWDGGGKCNRTHPYARKDVTVPQKNAQMNKVQAEELEKAMTLVTRGFPKLLLLNVTDSAAMRPDGHPDVYRNQPDNSPNDCLHWCLPGPIDMWNQLVLHTLEPIYRGKFLTATL